MVLRLDEAIGQAALSILFAMHLRAALLLAQIDPEVSPPAENAATG